MLCNCHAAAQRFHLYFVIICVVCRFKGRQKCSKHASETHKIGDDGLECKHDTIGVRLSTWSIPESS